MAPWLGEMPLQEMWWSKESCCLHKENKLIVLLTTEGGSFHDMSHFISPARTYSVSICQSFMDSYCATSFPCTCFPAPSVFPTSAHPLSLSGASWPLWNFGSYPPTVTHSLLLLPVSPVLCILLRHIAYLIIVTYLHICLSYLTELVEGYIWVFIMPPVFRVYRKLGAIIWHHWQITVPMLRRTV